MENLFDLNKTYRFTILKKKEYGYKELNFEKATQVRLIGNFPDELITFFDKDDKQQIFPFRDERNQPIITQVNEVEK